MIKFQMATNQTTKNINYPFSILYPRCSSQRQETIVRRQCSSLSQKKVVSKPNICNRCRCCTKVKALFYDSVKRALLLQVFLYLIFVCLLLLLYSAEPGCFVDYPLNSGVINGAALNSGVINGAALIDYLQLNSVKPPINAIKASELLTNNIYGQDPIPRPFWLNRDEVEQMVTSIDSIEPDNSQKIFIIKVIVGVALITGVILAAYYFGWFGGGSSTTNDIVPPTVPTVPTVPPLPDASNPPLPNAFKLSLPNDLNLSLPRSPAEIIQVRNAIVASMPEGILHLPPSLDPSNEGTIQRFMAMLQAYELRGPQELSAVAKQAIQELIVEDLQKPGMRDLFDIAIERVSQLPPLNPPLYPLNLPTK